MYRGIFFFCQSIGLVVFYQDIGLTSVKVVMSQEYRVSYVRVSDFSLVRV